MPNRREIGISILSCLACQPLLAGTGRPSDGFLSFILLFGFLVLLLGILQLLIFVKRKIRDFLEDIF